ncbi:MAG: sigma-70 family RNA polymerase sigma factor [Pirellulales bacterium]
MIEHNSLLEIRTMEGNAPSAEEGDRNSLTESTFQKAQGGCAQSMGELTERYHRWLCALAERELCPDLRVKIGISDLVQDTKLLALQAIHGFRGKSEREFRGLLRQILINRARSLARSYRSTHKRDIDREAGNDPKGFATDPQHNIIVDPGITPSHSAMVREDIERLLHLISSLPAEYREVVIQRSLQENSLEDIARHMNKSADAVRKMWVRAVLLLKDRLRDR